MADDEDKVSRRYRELPREEPPRRLDDAILAAARRAVHTRPAPLVVPTGRQRWYFPLAAAAIIVLVVAVTVHMEREQPAGEILSSNTVTAPAGAPEAAPSAPERFEMRDEARAQKPAPSRPVVSESKEELAAAQPAPAAPPQAAASAPSVAAERAPRADVMARESSGLAKLSRTPEQWLQAIVELREQGRHEEAERELAEFRRRNPAYRIPEAMLEKVEKR